MRSPLLLSNNISLRPDPVIWLVMWSVLSRAGIRARTARLPGPQCSPLCLTLTSHTETVSFSRGKQGKEGWDRLRRLTGMSWRILAVFKISAENPVGKMALTDFSFLLPVAPKAGDIFESSDLFSLNTASDVHFNLDISRSDISKWKTSMIWLDGASF